LALKTCTRSLGAVRAYGKIEIHLSQDTVITSSGLNYMASPIFVTAAADGSYTVQLQASNDLTPNGTYYTVTEYAIGTDYSYTVVVPQTAGPFDLVSIQTNPPTASPTASRVSTLTVDGAAIFTAGPITVPAAAFPESAITNLTSDLAAKATDSLAAHLAGVEAFTGVKTFSATPVFQAGFTVSAGLVTHGTGDETAGYSGTFTEQLIKIARGTGAVVDTTALPLVRVSRSSSLQGSQIATGNGIDEGAAFSAIAFVDSASQVQATGVLGIGKTQSSSAGNFGGGGQALNADAQGVVGIGQALSPSTRVGIGGFFEGIASAAGGLLSGVQINARNNSGSDAVVATTSFPQSQAVWLSSVGTNRAAEAITIGNPSGRQFDVGLHANGQVAGGFTGGINTAFIQDDSTATNSILISGTHTRAIGIKTGSGAIVSGHTNATDALTNSSALFELFTGSTNDTIAAFQGSGATNLAVKWGNTSGSHQIGSVGSTNNYITGTVAGDAFWRLNTASMHLLIGPGSGAALVVGQDGIVGINNGVAMGGGAAPTFGTIGGSGPATAAQNSWLKLNIAGTASYIPIWR